MPSRARSLWNQLRFHAWSLALVVICVYIAYPASTQSGSMTLDDLTNLNAPQRILLSWFYRHGHLPLWNPFNFGGQPFLAAGQSGPLYLPNVVYLLMPFQKAFAVSYRFHELLAAFGMYLVAWHLTRSRLSSITSSVIFTAGGFLIGHQIHTQMFDAMCWLPLCFFFTLRIVHHTSHPAMDALCLASCFAFEVCAGHPQITFYTLFVVILYLLLHWIQNRQTNAGQRGLWTVCALLVGLGLSAPQWVSTLNFVHYSDRAREASSFLLKGSFPVEGALQIFSPFTAGGGFTGVPFSVVRFLTLYHDGLFWEYLCFTGLIAFISAVSTSFTCFRDTESVRNLTFIGLISWILAYGQNGPLLYVLTRVPGFDLFRIPARYVGLFDFSVAILAGIGIRRLQDLQSPVQAIMLKVIRVVTALMLITWIALRLWSPLAWSPTAAFWVPILLMVLTLCVTFTRPWFIRWASTFTVLTVLEVCLQAHLFATFPWSEHANYLTPSPVVRYVKTHLDPRDPFTRTATFDADSLSHDQSAAYQIPSLNGYDSLEPEWYAQNVNLTWSPDTLLEQPRSLVDRFDVKYVITKSSNSEQFPTHVSGVQTWSHTWPTLPKGTTAIVLTVSETRHHQVSQFGPLFTITFNSGTHVFEKTLYGELNPQTSFLLALPKDWPQNCSVRVSLQNESWRYPNRIETFQFVSGASVLHAMNMNVTLGPRPWHLAFTDGNEEVWTNPDPIENAWALHDQKSMYDTVTSHSQMTSWSPNKQMWNVTSPGGLWVLSQTFDPNWVVTVDGVGAVVSKVGDSLTGVSVRAGTHVITLQYRPGSWRMGLLIAFVSIGIWVGILVIGLSNKPKPALRPIE